MARASVYTLIPLDRVAAIWGIDPLHFNSVVSERRPERHDCDDLWFQYDWQDAGRVSRESLAMELRTAEDLVFKNLGYFLLPKWVEKEEHVIEPPYAVERVNPYGLNSRLRAKSIRANWGFVLEGGVRTASAIELDAPVNYSDLDGDGYKETATVTVSTSVTNEWEIRVYFPGMGADDTWEIRPISVDLNTTTQTATITFRRELCVDPELWEKVPAPYDTALVVDGDDDTNFTSTVDVYRVYNDPSSQVTFISEPSNTTNPTEESGFIHVRDSRNGILAYYRADWDAATNQYVFSTFQNGIEPQKLVVNYLAGRLDWSQPSPYRQMSPIWERLIAYYTLSLLRREPMGCDNFKAIYDLQTEDLAKASREGSFAIMPEDLRNPLGTSRAAISLWKLIQRERLVFAR